MNENTAEGTQAPGRQLRVTACGDTASEIELAALDVARKFFGGMPRLEIVPDYIASSIGPHSWYATSGKAYVAEVTIRLIETAEA